MLNAGGKDIFPSSIGISTVLEMTQERLRKQQRAGYIIWEQTQSCGCAVGSVHVYGYDLADYTHQVARVLTCRSGKGGKVSYSPFPNWLPTMSNACSCI